MTRTLKAAGELLELIAREAVKGLPQNLAAVQATLRANGIDHLEIAVSGREVRLEAAMGAAGPVDPAGILVEGYRSWGCMESADGHEFITVAQVSRDLEEACSDLGEDLLRRKGLDWAEGASVAGLIRIPATGEPEIDCAPAEPVLEEDCPAFG